MLSKTPLHEAIEQNLILHIHGLLRAGASTTIPNARGLTPLQIAATHDNDLLANILLMYQAPSTKGPNGLSPLETAAQHGSVRVGSLLLSTTPVPTNTLVDALHEAISNRHVKFIQLLLESTQSTSLTDSDFENLLDTFRKTVYHDLGQRKIIAQLLISRISNKNKTLHFAVENKDEYLSHFLLESGTNPNPAASRLQSPLACAVKHHYRILAQLLLQYKANPNYQDHNEMTPWAYLFRAKGSFEFARELLSTIPLTSKFKGKTPLHWAAEHGRTDIVRWLLNNNADRREVDDAYNTPLRLALKNRNLKVALLLMLAHIKNHITAYSLALPTFITACLAYKQCMSTLYSAAYKAGFLGKFYRSTLGRLR